MCKVQSWDKDSRALVFEMMTVDQNVYRDVLNLQKQIQDTLYNEKNPITRQQKIADYQSQIVQKQANLYKPSGLKFDVKAYEEYAVRTKDLPLKFDDKGNLVVPTEKEKKEKYDKKHGGYAAEPDDLHANVIVQVTLVKKEGSGAKLPDILRYGPKPGSGDQEVKLDANIQASLIMIVSDASNK
jgi:hypothetical protein